MYVTQKLCSKINLFFNYIFTDFKNSIMLVYTIQFHFQITVSLIEGSQLANKQCDYSNKLKSYHFKHTMNKETTK